MPQANVPVDRFLTVELVGWRDRTSGRFKAGSGAARGEVATLATDCGDLLVAALAKESPRSPVHKPGTVRFAASWRASVKRGDGGAELLVENIDPKRGYVMFPTKPHGPAHARVLRFVVAGGHVVFAHRVKGTKGNDVLGRVMAKASGPLRDALQRSTVKVQQHITDIWK